jgi:hypothetical protein
MFTALENKVIITTVAALSPWQEQIDAAIKDAVAAYEVYNTKSMERI